MAKTNKNAARSAARAAARTSSTSGSTSKPGDAVPTEGQDGPNDVRRQLPTDIARPSATNDDTSEGGEGTGDDRPTAREGLRPTGLERPHPTAAARPAKTAGEAERQAMTGARLAEVGDPNRADPRGKPNPIRVEATQMGYYDDIRRRTGDVFDIRNAEDFSPRWMRPVDGSTPEKLTSGNEDIARQNEETRRAKRGERTGTRSSDTNPLEA